MKIGIIGCSGHWGQAKAWASAAADARDGEDTSPLRALNVPYYANWRDMLDNIDVAVVDSRYDMHAAIAMECLRRGKHVYCEKPLATKTRDLDELERTWRASGMALGGMFNLRYCGWFLALQTAIEDGEIGEIRLMHGQKSYRLGHRPAFYGIHEQFGGLIPWVAIHAIDWILTLGGRCTDVTARQSRKYNAGNGDLEVSAVMQMTLENEVLATVSADYFRPLGSARHDDDRLRVTGTRGMLEALNGEVYLENGQPRRRLSVGPDLNPFAVFLDAIERGGAEELACRAIESTRVALKAIGE